MKHDVWVQRQGGRFLAKCDCGWRGSKWQPHEGWATEEADEHEHKAKHLQLNSGSTPSLKTLAEDYRKKSQSDVYTAQERLQWVKLAQEIEERLRGPQNAIDGQIELF